MSIKTSALAGFILATLPLASNAAIINTATQIHGFAGVPTYSEASSGQAPLTFNQFDGSLGTLLGVFVRANVGVDGGSIFVDNDGVDPATGDADLGASLTISSGDVTLLDGGFGNIGSGVTASNNYIFNLAADDGDGAGVDSTPNDGASAAGIAANASEGFTGVNSTFFAQYTGLGTFDIDYAVSSIFQINFTGGVAGGFNPVNSTGSVEIFYQYDDGEGTGVPTPAPLALLGLGLIGMLRKLRS